MSYPTIDWIVLRKELRTRMRNRASELDPNKPYEIPDIVGRKWWNQFSGKQQRRIGSIGASLVRKREVPFVKVDETSEQHNLYVLASHNTHEVA